MPAKLVAPGTPPGLESAALNDDIRVRADSMAPQFVRRLASPERDRRPVGAESVEGAARAASVHQGKDGTTGQALETHAPSPRDR